MAATPFPSFTQTGGLFLTATTTSARSVLPTSGTPTIALVSNTGERVAFVALGDNTVVASNTSVAVMPGHQIALTIGTAVDIAIVTVAAICGISVVVGN